MKKFFSKQRLLFKVVLFVMILLFITRFGYHAYCFVSLRGVNNEVRKVMLEGAETESWFTTPNLKFRPFGTYAYNNDPYSLELLLKRKHALLLGDHGYIWYKYEAYVKKDGKIIETKKNDYFRIEIVKEDYTWKWVSAYNGGINYHYYSRSPYYDWNWWKSMFYEMSVEEPCVLIQWCLRLII